MIEINNLTDFSVDKQLILGVAKKVLKSENKETENLSIAFVHSAEIKKINKKYRHKDKPTDVLSFEVNKSMQNDFREVIICPEILKDRAQENKTTFKEEVVKVLVHGVLHTLGYDHERSKTDELKMEKKEKYYLAEILK